MNERSVIQVIGRKAALAVKKDYPDKKTAILESALELIREHGFHGTPMSQVAKKAGVAAGTLYIYFESKCHLINELYVYVQEQMLDAVLQGDNPEYELKQRIIHFWHNHYRYYINNPASLNFLEQYVNSPYCAHGSLHDHERFQQVIGNLFRSGVESGRLKQMDIRLFGIIIHGSIINAAKTFLSGRILIGDKELSQIFGILWEGIKN